MPSLFDLRHFHAAMPLPPLMPRRLRLRRCRCHLITPLRRYAAIATTFAADMLLLMLRYDDADTPCRFDYFHFRHVFRACARGNTPPLSLRATLRRCRFIRHADAATPPMLTPHAATPLMPLISSPPLSLFMLLLLMPLRYAASYAAAIAAFAPPD